MPEEGVTLTPHQKLLTTEEVIRLSSLLVRKLGVNKIRLTGGEPLVRRDFMDILKELNKLRPYGLRTIAMTTNGLALNRKIAQLKENGERRPTERVLILS